MSEIEMAQELFRIESPSGRVFILEKALRGKDLTYKILEPKLRTFIQLTFQDRAAVRAVMQADVEAEENALRDGNPEGYDFADAYKQAA
jgi:hypothetical protein